MGGGAAAHDRTRSLLRLLPVRLLPQHPTCIRCPARYGLLAATRPGDAQQLRVGLDREGLSDRKRTLAAGLLRSECDHILKARMQSRLIAETTKRRNDRGSEGAATCVPVCRLNF